MSDAMQVVNTLDDYLDVLRDWRAARVGLLFLLVAAALLPYKLTTELVRAGVIGKSGMVVLRVPILAVAIVYWLWAFQYQIKVIIR